MEPPAEGSEPVAGEGGLDPLTLPPSRMIVAAAPVQMVPLGEVPLGVVEEGAYCLRHLDVHLSPQHALMLRRLVVGLVKTGARRLDKEVHTPQEAIRWLMERLYQQSLRLAPEQ